jgi:predicted histone-like DNA-binding protein
MASRIQAIRHYKPRLKRSRRIEPDEFAEYVASISSLSEGDVRHALSDISRALLSLLRSGQSVRLEGLGLVMPSIDTQGQFTVRLKPDRKLRLDVRNPQDYFGEVINRQHLGKDGDKLVALWNAEHPDDLVE